MIGGVSCFLKVKEPFCGLLSGNDSLSLIPGVEISLRAVDIKGFVETSLKQVSLEPALGIDYFNRGHWLSSAQVRYSLKARRKLFDAWQKFRSSKSVHRVLDVGATPDTERGDSNCMVPWLQQEGIKVFLSSPENISHLAKIFPGVAVLEKFPVGETFDWAISSATLEHVGKREQQESFVRELASVAKQGIFLTTPNRFHWLEFHTKLPFLHWLPRGVYSKILKMIGLTFWSDETNLRLVGQKEILEIANAALGNRFQIRVAKVRSLGMVSNFALMAERKS